MAAALPNIGDWYRLDGGESFEVVAFDADDGTIEIQYADGAVEEMELEDWTASAEEKRLAEAEPPEDWSGSPDADSDSDGLGADDYDERRLGASSLDGLDMFE
jgi:hypothetical protein